MSDAADLARRFLMLWEDYLAALLANPSEAELLQRWLRAAAPSAAFPGPRDSAAGAQARQSGPAVGAPPASGASDERDDAVAQLARRIAALEERVAAVERGGRAVAASARRNRRNRGR